ISDRRAAGVLASARRAQPARVPGGALSASICGRDPLRFLPQRSTSEPNTIDTTPRRVKRDPRTRRCGGDTGRARTHRYRSLAVRELENMLLHSASLHEVILRRCAELGIKAPELEDISEALRTLFAATQDSKLFPAGLPDGRTPEQVVVGSEVLNRLYWQFVK